MTFPQKIGLMLLLVAVLAAVAYHQGLSLPSLRWFYSFRATPEQIQNATEQGNLITVFGKGLIPINPHRFLERQHEIVGDVICGVMAFVAVLLLILGGKFQWNPLTLRRFSRFRSIGRGWASFQLLILLLVLAMLDQVLVGKRALELGASALIMAHNHPSGDPSPSREDIALTREVKKALETVGVSLHDHIIVGRKGHCSLRSLKVIEGWK